MIDHRFPNFLSTPVAEQRPRFEYAPTRAGAGELRRPVVSVVTPFYNMGDVFHETAACLLGPLPEGVPAYWSEKTRGAPGQSLQNFEWIIVNDCSTNPDSAQALEPYRVLARRDRRVRVIDLQQNHGLPAARNAGWRAARAPCVFFLDADDLIEPTTLEKSALHLACNPEFAFVKGFSVGFGAQEYLWLHGFHKGEEMLKENVVTATTMVRRSALAELGGFDESIRGGMEDWEFWLRAAAMGHWGDTIPEFLDWYRRRENQHAEWENIAKQEKRSLFLRKVRAAHGHIFEGRFPSPSRAWHMPFIYPAPPLDERKGADNHEPELVNPLDKRRRRLLMIVPWLRMGGADRFNLDLLRYLTEQGIDASVQAQGSDAQVTSHDPWEVTIATTLPGHPWLPEFTALTPDVFCLDHLARPPQFPRLISHLIESRRPDVVMVSNSQLGYFLLPYLRSRHPETTFVDFNHMEEPHWQNGGHPRTGAGFQEQLDLSIVVSGHLKRWMSAPPRNADAERIEVCHINADTRTFRPDAEARARVRAELGIDDDVPMILYAARLCPQKQPLVFGRAMELLRELYGEAGCAERKKHGSREPRHQQSSFVGLVAGEGELQDSLAAYLAERELGSHVRMLGAVAAADMPGLMAAADIFFLPSQWEGIALSIYEAMAAGRCVVGADVGGQAELVTQETGVLLKFSSRDAELEAKAYAAALHGLIADPKRIGAYGKAARARIQEHFELDAMGSRMEALFEIAHRWRRERPRQVISEPFARELALQGIEMMRIQDLCDELWPYRQKYLDRASGSARFDPEQRRHAEDELAKLELSRSWRAIQMAKSTPPYKMLARVRFGPDWRLADLKDPPEVRLARIRASRTYRLIVGLERSRRNQRLAPGRDEG